MIVVDASALVHVLIRSSAGSAVRVRDRLEDLHATVTVDAEVLHALRGLWLAKLIDDERARVAVAGFRDVEITRHPIEPLVSRMWALRNNVTAYDAAYVVLAETLDAPLVTRDARLDRSSGHAATPRVHRVESPAHGRGEG